MPKTLNEIVTESTADYSAQHPHVHSVMADSLGIGRGSWGGKYTNKRQSVHDYKHSVSGQYKNQAEGDKAASKLKGDLQKHYGDRVTSTHYRHYDGRGASMHAHIAFHDGSKKAVTAVQKAVSSGANAARSKHQAGVKAYKEVSAKIIAAHHLDKASHHIVQSGHSSVARSIIQKAAGHAYNNAKEAYGEFNAAHAGHEHAGHKFSDVYASHESEAR